MSTPPSSPPQSSPLDEDFEEEEAARLESLQKLYPSLDFNKVMLVGGKDYGRLPRVSYDQFHYRSDLENGQLVEKQAKKCSIHLKDEPPEGCDKESYHMRFLEKVTSNPSGAYYVGSTFNNTDFQAILTEDEFAKLNGMDEVEEAFQMHEGFCQF